MSSTERHVALVSIGLRLRAAAVERVGGPVRLGRVDGRVSEKVSLAGRELWARGPPPRSIERAKSALFSFGKADARLRAYSYAFEDAPHDFSVLHIKQDGLGELVAVCKRTARFRPQLQTPIASFERAAVADAPVGRALAVAIVHPWGDDGACAWMVWDDSGAPPVLVRHGFEEDDLLANRRDATTAARVVLCDKAGAWIASPAAASVARDLGERVLEVRLGAAAEGSPAYGAWLAGPSATDHQLADVDDLRESGREMASWGLLVPTVDPIDVTEPPLVPTDALLMPLDAAGVPLAPMRLHALPTADTWLADVARETISSALVALGRHRRHRLEAVVDAFMARVAAAARDDCGVDDARVLAKRDMVAACFAHCAWRMYDGGERVECVVADVDERLDEVARVAAGASAGEWRARLPPFILAEPDVSQAPLVVGLSAPPGSGKTTILRALRDWLAVNWPAARVAYAAIDEQCDVPKNQAMGRTFSLLHTAMQADGAQVCLFDHTLADAAARTWLRNVCAKAGARCLIIGVLPPATAPGAQKVHLLVSLARVLRRRAGAGDDGSTLVPGSDGDTGERFTVAATVTRDKWSAARDGVGVGAKAPAQPVDGLVAVLDSDAAGALAATLDGEADEAVLTALGVFVPPETGDDGEPLTSRQLGALRTERAVAERPLRLGAPSVATLTALLNKLGQRGAVVDDAFLAALERFAARADAAAIVRPVDVIAKDLWTAHVQPAVGQSLGQLRLPEFRDAKAFLSAHPFKYVGCMLARETHKRVVGAVLALNLFDFEADDTTIVDRISSANSPFVAEPHVTLLFGDQRAWLGPREMDLVRAVHGRYDERATFRATHAVVARDTGKAGDDAQHVLVLKCEFLSSPNADLAEALRAVPLDEQPFHLTLAVAGCRAVAARSVCDGVRAALGSAFWRNAADALPPPSGSAVDVYLRETDHIARVLPIGDADLVFEGVIAYK